MRISILYLDLKGDEAAFHGCRQLCAERGIPFDYFTTDRRKHSMTINPFLQPIWPGLDITERVQILMQALGIETGPGYGKGYFSDTVEYVADRFFRTYPDIRSFREAGTILQDGKTFTKIKVTQKNFEHAGHLVAAINRLGNIEPLNAATSDIQLINLYEQPRFFYAFMPVTLEPMSARVCARMFMHLHVATARLVDNRVSPIQQYVVIDEAQEVISRNVGPLCKQARDRGISYVFSLQQLADLKQGSEDLTSAITGNCRVKIYLSAKDKVGRDEITQASGIRRDTYVSKGRDITEREVKETRITIDEIHRLNNDPNLAVLDVAPGSGYTQFTRPVFIRTDFHITKEEFERLKAMPWPEAPTPPSAPAPVAQPPSPDVHDIIRRLKGN